MFEHHYNQEKIIIDPIWNNFFSYQKRKEKWSECKICLPKAIYIDNKNNLTSELSQSKNICFEEIDENNITQKCHWLKNHIIYKNNDQYIFIIDNHNHALYRWFLSYSNRIMPKWLDVIHIDQHADLWIPSEQISQNIYNLKKSEQENCVYNYTNNISNVWNFMIPWQQIWLIWKVHQVRSRYKLQNIYEEINANQKLSWYILDIDCDFWSDKIDLESIKITKNLMKKASIITIATSPFFIDFDKSKKVLELLLS